MAMLTTGERMFNFLKRKQGSRKSFKEFVLERTQSNPTINLPDALDQYIKENNLIVQTHPDETHK